MTMTDTERTAPNKRGAETREKLIDATISLVVEWGPDAVNLRGIGRECEQKNNSVCQFHFGTKEGTLRAAADRVIGPVIRGEAVDVDSIEFTARLLASRKWRHLAWQHPAAVELPAEVLAGRVRDVLVMSFVSGRI